MTVDLTKRRRSISASRWLVVLLAVAAGAVSSATFRGSAVGAWAQPAPPAYPAAVLADVPLAYWRHGESENSNMADASGNGRFSILTGGVTLGSAGAVVGDADSALSFDGETGSARSSNPVAVGADFTIEAWVKASQSKPDGTIVSLYAGGEQQPGTEQSASDRLSRTLSIQGQRIVGTVDMSSDWPNYAVWSTSLDATIWHHLVFAVQNSTNLRLYVDGALAGSASVPATAGFSANAVVGWSDATWVPHFAGTIDEVAIYSAALSADRVQAHYVAAGARCDQSLQQRISVAARDAVVSVPPCMYRETVTINKPLTLAGQPGAEIRGSDVWTAWSQTGSTWTSQQSVPALPIANDSDGRCAEPTLRCLIPEQVFQDGRALYPVGTARPGAGQFGIDGGRHVILADDPTGRLMEVTTRNRWIITAADGVTIQGFNMRHAGNDAQTGAVANDGYSSWTLQDNALSDAHGAVVGADSGTQLRALRNDIGRGGSLGIHAFLATDSIIQGNHLHDNNTDLFNPGWEAGGVKAGRVQRVVLDNNEVEHSGSGIWCDEGCDYVTVSANRVHDNAYAGIVYEISKNGSLHDNASWNNGRSNSWIWGGGIVISSSANTEVYNNILAWNAVGISLVEQRRGPALSVRNLRVHDNNIASADGTLGLAWMSDTSEQQLFAEDTGNLGTHNRYWYPNAEGSQPRFAWRGQKFTLADFAQTPGDSGGSYLSSSEKDLVLTSRGLPAVAPSV